MYSFCHVITYKNRINILKLFKSLVIFGNVNHNLVAEVMEMMNHTGLWDTKHAWYSLNATCQICHYRLEHCLGIHDLRPTWPCLIIKVLATWTKLFDTIRLLYRNQQHVSHNKCFWPLPWRYGPVQTHKAWIPK